MIKAKGMEMQNRDWEYWFNVIVDQLAESISREKKTELTEWRNASEENERQYTEILKLWNALSLSERNENFDGEKAFRMFKERVYEETATTKTQRREIKKIPMPRRQLFRQVALYAAILIPFVVLSYFTYRYLTIESAQKEPLQLSEISVPNGSKTHLKLPDGTAVWLNAGSTIQYNSDFGKATRILTLSGEAYFEVVRNEKMPFVVNAGDVNVKVLGTHFNVNAYVGNNYVAVALMEGAVEMNVGKTNRIVLKPGDLARYDISDQKIDVAQNSSLETLNWMENRLVFTGETFEQIMLTLERNFGMEVKIHNDQIKKRQFAGDFVNNENIDQILRVMSANGKFRYKINGNTIDIY